MSRKYGIMEIDEIKFYALAAMEGILSCYSVQQTEEGPKLDLPPPELLANTAFAYAEAMYVKQQQVANLEAELSVQSYHKAGVMMTAGGNV